MIAGAGSNAADHVAMANAANRPAHYYAHVRDAGVAVPGRRRSAGESSSAASERRASAVPPPSPQPGDPMPRIRIPGYEVPQTASADGFRPRSAMR
jgi:hypothetical protein